MAPRRRSARDPVELYRRFRAMFEAGLIPYSRQIEGELDRAAEGLRRKIADLEHLRAQQDLFGDDPAWTELMRRRAETLAEQVANAGQGIRDVLDGAPIEWAEAAAIKGAKAADEILAAYGIEPAVRFDPERVIAVSSLLFPGGGQAPSPFASLYDAGQRRALRDILIDAATQGTNPRAIANAVRDALGIGEVRALTTARTEVLRAMRRSALTRYRDVPEVDGWVWISARDSRTCAFCWAMHGTIHPLDEEMATHPNCRCSQAPRVSRDTEADKIATGTVEFRKLSAEAQRHILGPKAYAAYKSGAVKLRDFAGQADHPLWGRVGYRRPLRDILAGLPASKVATATPYALDVRPELLAEIRAEFPDIDQWIGEIVKSRRLGVISSSEIAEAYNRRKAYTPGTLDPETRDLARRLGLPLDPIDMTRPTGRPAGMPPADDLAAVEAWLKANPNLAAGGFTVNLAEYDAIVRGLTASELSLLAERFPGVAKWLKAFESHVDPDARVWAHYEWAPNARISFSERWAKDLDRFYASAKNAAEQGFHGVDTGISDVMAHEFGHTVMDRLGIPKVSAALKRSFGAAKRTGGLPTGYSDKNVREAFAEAFVEIWHGRESNAFVRAVREVLDANDVLLLR